MKLKLFSCFMAMVLLMGVLFGCGKKTDEPADTDGEPSVTVSDATKEPKPEDTTDYAALLAFQFEGLTDSPASDFTYTEADGSVTITAYVGMAEKVRIPSAIDGKPVSALGEGAFLDRKDLKILYIPDSVAAFGANILKGCDQIYALRTPLPSAEGTRFLGYLYGAMDHRTNNTAELRNLDFLEIGGTPTKLPSYSLYDCNDLVAVKLPETVTTLETYSLYRCESLKYLNTDRLTVIESHAMDFCLSLESLAFSDSLESIGLGAFENCLSLRRITLPFIGKNRTENAFLGYIFGAAQYGFSKGFYPSSLVSVTVTDDVAEIGECCFYECGSLRSVSLPDTVTSIGVRAFSGCSSLTEIQLPNGVTSIGDGAFSGCTALASVSLGSTLQSVGVNAFLNCVSLTEIVLPATLTALPNSCFHGCDSLKSVDLGGVSKVGKNAFYGCASLESVVTSIAKIKFEDGNQLVEDLLRS